MNAPITRTDLSTFLYSSTNAEPDAEKRLREASWYFQHSPLLASRLTEECVAYATKPEAQSVMEFFQVYEPCIFVRDTEKCVDTIAGIMKVLYPKTYDDPYKVCSVVFRSFPDWDKDAQRRRQHNDDADSNDDASGHIQHEMQVGPMEEAAGNDDASGHIQHEMQVEPMEEAAGSNDEQVGPAEEDDSLFFDGHGYGHYDGTLTGGRSP